VRGSNCQKKPQTIYTTSGDLMVGDSYAKRCLDSFIGAGIFSSVYNEPSHMCRYCEGR